MFNKYNIFKVSFLLLMSCIIFAGISKPSYAGIYQYTIEAGSYQIVDTEDGHQQIEMEGFGQLMTDGKPKLPSKIFSIAIPPDSRVVSVEVEGVQPTELPGTYDILPVPPSMPGSGDITKAKELFEKNYQLTYSSDTPYPSNRGEFICQGGYRKYNVVDVRYTPFEYLPKSGKLYFYPRAVVTITYESDVSYDIGKGLMSENIAEVEENAQELITNYQDARNWYPAGPAPSNPGYDFVIITTEALKDSVLPIKNWEICKGREVYVATTEWIDDNYLGNDLAAKMRNFLRANLAGWGILKVLLVGDIDDVPMRYCWTESAGETWGWYPTDYYYAELSLSDYDSWDDDFDMLYGEEGQDSIDFLNEVDVGRIPWSDPNIVEAICRKMAEYEYSTNMAFKKNVLLPEAFWDVDTDNALLANLMLTDFFNGAGWTKTRMYEYGPTFYSTYPRDVTLTHTNMVNYWSTNHYGYVCWSGHGSPTAVEYNHGHGGKHFIESGDSSSLNDNYPSVVYSNSCSTAYPENSQNFGRQLLRQGAVAFVGSTRVMIYRIGWNEVSDGWGNTLAYLFSQRVHSGLNSVGWSHQKALRQMYTDYGWDNHWFSMFEYVLYGNPDQWIKNRPSALPNLEYVTPSGWSYPIVPRSAGGATGASCPITATLPGNTDNTYYNWAWTNSGASDAPLHKTRLYLDDQYLCWSGVTLPAGTDKKYNNYQFSRTVCGGRHTMYYVIDEEDAVWETDETDNAWGHQFVWSPYALADDSPVTRSAPPDKDAWGSAPAPHYYNNDGFSFLVQQEHPDKWWSAVGILPGGSTSDYDLRLWNIGDYTGSEGGFGAGYLQWSQWGGDASDFVIVNDNTSTAGTYYAGVINNNDGSANYRIEEDTTVKIYAGTNGPFSKSTTNVLDTYECYLQAGDYGFKLDQTYGTCDLGMSLYDDETTNCRKSDYMIGGYANSNGDGADESFQVTIPDSGYHLLVVWKVDSSDYSKSSTYNIKFGLCATPGTPANPNPPNGATDVSVNTDLDWSDCADTDHYEVWLREGTGSWAFLGTTEESQWELDPLNPNTTYTWTIKAVNICGNYAWGPYWDFTTGEEPTITVTTPNGGEEWYVGKSYSIRWTSQAVTGNVKIQISRDGGLIWSTITSDTPNDGIYSWTVTSPTSTTCRIKVTSLDFPSATDTSNANFTIAKPFITVIYPDGGEKWYAGDNYEIQWESGGAEKYLKIEISRDNGRSWFTITNNALNTGSYTWLATGPAAKECLIRISDTTLSDTSDFPFSIYERSITVKSPNGGELWFIGEPRIITWSSLNVTGDVNIEVSRDAGSTWSTIVDSTANDGLYDWPVNKPPSHKCLVRITSVSYPSVSDVSNGWFTVTFRSDINLDLAVDTLDLDELCMQWLNSGDPADCPLSADITHDDCFVNFLDFAILASEWLEK